MGQLTANLAAPDCSYTYQYQVEFQSVAVSFQLLLEQ